MISGAFCYRINFVADELVALLATLGDILKLNHAILGLTVLGCGNSMADLAADMSVTRAGFPNMAVTAAYAGPFFNMCIGIGLSFLTKVMASDDGKFDYGSLDTTLLLAGCWLIGVRRRPCSRARRAVCDMALRSALLARPPAHPHAALFTLPQVCVITMVFAGCNGLHLPPIFGWLGIMMYVVFCVVAVLVVNYAPAHVN